MSTLVPIAVVEGLLDARLGAGADRHHRDDRPDADDDAQRREERAELVSHDRAQRDAKGVDGVHRSVLTKPC
jgi:hypothetical protein